VVEAVPLTAAGTHPTIAFMVLAPLTTGPSVGVEPPYVVPAWLGWLLVALMAPGALAFVLALLAAVFGPQPRSRR